MISKSLAELRRSLDAKEFSSVELTQSYLDRIARHNPALNAFITVTEETALTSAREADQRIAQQQATALTGIPLAHKDIFCTRGVLSSCASKMLSNFISPYDAHVVSLLREAGMVMLGKTNMDEFAMGSSNENSFYGPARNPWHTEHVPGGSSGGSAIAVAARLAPVATGTDTGGSIRQPASLTGVTGIKPGYGLVSRYGMIAYASSLDQGGVFGISAEDCAIVLGAMVGFDPRDSTSLQREPQNYQAALQTGSGSLKGLKIGIPKEFFAAGLDAEVHKVIEQGLQTYRKLGAELVDISLPNAAELAIPAYYVIAPAEASSNLSRYDGVRYGWRSGNYSNLDEMYCNSRSEGFGDEVKRRILIGTYVLSHGYYDAYYLQAQKLRRLIAEDFRSAFTRCDLIAGPVSPTTAWKIGAKTDDPVQMYLSDIYTIAVNLAGLPGMSHPCGFAADGLPVGMQLIGNYFQEAQLLQTAHQFQQQTDWHTRMPSLAL